MVATKLRVIAWTQRRCFHGPQFTPATPLALSRTGSSGRSCNSANFRSSSGEAVTTYWIGLFRSRLSSGTQATHENCGKRRLLFAHVTIISSPSISRFLTMPTKSAPIGDSTPAVPSLSIHQAGTEDLPFDSSRKFLIFSVPECPSGCSTAFR
jgi:hypothetical protein